MSVTVDYDSSPRECGEEVADENLCVHLTSEDYNLIFANYYSI